MDRGRHFKRKTACVRAGVWIFFESDPGPAFDRRKRVPPKRWTHLNTGIKLLAASVGPLLTWARCQAAIWVAPTDERPAEPADLRRAVGVLQVLTKAGDPLQGEAGIGVEIGGNRGC